MALYVRPIRLTGADQIVKQGVCRWFGFAVRETAEVARVTLRVYDGTSAAGTLIDTIALAAGESRSEWVGATGVGVEPGLVCENGLFIDVAGAGVLEGSVRLVG